MSDYPSEFEDVVSSADGRSVQVRPIRPDDAPTLRREIDAADEKTLYLRFFQPRPVFDDETIATMTNLDYDRRFALLAEFDGEPVAVARYEALTEPGRAEVAVAVKREWRRQGLAAGLLQRVMDRAATCGFEAMEATCLVENEPAIRLFEAAGFTFGPVDRGIRLGEANLTRRR